MLMTRWLRWLVVTPVLLFVFGAILLSCTSGGGSSATATPSPGFRLQSLAISEGPPPSPTATPPIGPTPKKKTPTPTLTPRPEATSTSVTTNPVQFDAIGTFTKKKKTQFVDLTIAPLTLWTSRDPGNFDSAKPGCRRRQLYDWNRGMHLYPGEQFGCRQPDRSGRSAGRCRHMHRGALPYSYRDDYAYPCGQGRTECGEHEHGGVGGG